MRRVSTNIYVGHCLLLALLCMAVLSHAQVRMGGGWQHLGSAHVDGRADHDKISVSGGTFTALNWESPAAPLDLNAW